VSAAPLVSVVMTAYNRERYVGAAIESVLAQTFADFELIVVDDGSVDRTVEVARQYEDDPRLRIVLNERNLGDYPNRNRAAALARGRFLKYHDSDDVMYPHCLSTMVGPLDAERRAGFALSGAASWASWAGGPCPMLLTPRMCYQREFLGTQGLFMCGPASALFRADVFRALGGFPHVGVGSDYVFWLRACARVSVLLVSGDLFWYRIHPGQEIQKPAAAAECAHAWRQAWPALLATDCPLTAEERVLAKRNWTFIIARDALRALRSGQWNAARLRLGHAGLSWTDWLRYLRPPRRDRLAGSPMSRHEGGAVERRAPHRAGTLPGSRPG
jgi:cellulose synthase/poly-beta-1,6-N-acetylglucosamine synthase-like glycosyltransferase